MEASGTESSVKEKIILNRRGRKARTAREMMGGTDKGPDK